MATAGVVRRLEGATRGLGLRRLGRRRRRVHGWFGVDLERLQWITIVAPPLFIVLLALASYVPHELGLLGHEGEHALVAVILIAAALAFSPVAFRVIRDAQRRLVSQNAQLAELHRDAIGWSDALDALHHAALAVTSELSLEAVLQRVVDLSCELVQAKYGALVVRGAGDEPRQFVTSGLSDADARRANLPVDGRMLLADQPALLETTKAQDPGAIRLCIPIRFKGRDIGALFVLSESEPFGDREVKLLSMFALQAAIAIENARLYEEVQRVAVVEERERIARDIHDGLGQLLGYLNTKAQAVGELLTAGRHDVAARQVEQLVEAAQELHADLREAITGLRAPSQAQPCLQLLLREMAQRFEEQSGLSIHVDVPQGLASLTLGATADGEMARIVQEALTNVRKHAKATQAWVRLRRAGDGLTVWIEDDGHGFDPQQLPNGTFGLRCMAERASKLGARLHVDGAPGRPTRVQVTLPTARASGWSSDHARPRR